MSSGKSAPIIIVNCSVGVWKAWQVGWGLANSHILHCYYRLWHCQSYELKLYKISFSPKSKVHILSDSLTCHCWNNLRMKRYVLSLVKSVITLPRPRLLRTKRNRGSFSIYAVLVLRHSLPGSGPSDSSVFTTTYYHTKATFTVWALWLAADLKAAILNMNGADSLMFFFAVDKNYLLQVSELCRISSMQKIFVTHIHFLLTRFPPPPPRASVNTIWCYYF